MTGSRSGVCASASLSGASRRRMSTQPQKTNADQKTYLITLARSEPPQGREWWTLRLLAERPTEVGMVEKISHVAVWKALRDGDGSHGSIRLRRPNDERLSPQTPEGGREPAAPAPPPVLRSDRGRTGGTAVALRTAEQRPPGRNLLSPASVGAWLHMDVQPFAERTQGFFQRSDASVLAYCLPHLASDRLIRRRERGRDR